MSRIGKQPVVVPKGVKAVIAGQLLKVEGPKGKLERELRPEITAKLEGETIILTRNGDDGRVRAFHGLERALVHNMVEGVSKGFEKELQLIGVGYRADSKGNTLNLALGHSHPIDFELPDGVKGTVIKEGRDISIKLESMDKQLLGQTAAQIRSLREPEPYKGKGVRYKGEVIKMKAGKSGKK
ncbi:MAG: 50S ribosomal protein L6 [Bdellovibrionota bacterium]